MLDQEQRAGKILIVDDNMANVKLLEKILMIDGYIDIIHTTDSRQVENIYNKEQPDVILLDLHMPYVNGFEIMEKFNERGTEDYLPIIVITAQNDHESFKKALELGARDFIGKPFHFEEVFLRVKNMLEVRLLHKKARFHNEQLEKQVKERTNELEESKRELIRRLGLVATYRDNETGFHLARMSLLVGELAKEIGLSPKEVELLQHASTMHDIGKIAISDSILLKNGPLSNEEWVIMKTHTTKGADLLSGGESSEVLKLAEVIAISHHERWNGTGYPHGLKGEDIPFAGRLCAICDVFDALLSKRPYKREWSFEEAVAEVKKGAGGHFDPQIVNVFLSILPRIKNIVDNSDDMDKGGWHG